MIPDLYPKTQKLVNPMEFATGKMVPSGVTVHYTADGSARKSIAALKGAGLGYHIIIDRDGTVYQTCYLTQSVYHAGKAMWNGRSPNRHHLAVAVVSWGAVTLKDGNYRAWTGMPLPREEVQRREGNLGSGDYHWHVCTRPQENALLAFLRWAVSKGIKPEDVCGHDECAIPKGRKADPGGVLSLSMLELRDALKNKPGS